MIESTDIVLPYIVSDFDAGDRVWSYRYGSKNPTVFFGTVKRVEGNDIIVTMDSAGERRVSVKLFQKQSTRTSYWGKSLPLQHLAPGSVVSLSLNGYKMLAVVNRVSSESLTVTYQSGHHLVNTFVTTQKESLEQQVMFWELED